MSSACPIALTVSEGVYTDSLPQAVAANVRQLDVLPAVGGHSIPSVVATINSLSGLKSLAFFAEIEECTQLWASPLPLHAGVSHLTFSSEEALSQHHLAILFQLFPGVERADLHFNVEEDDQGFVYRADPAHYNIGPLVNRANLIFTWHDYDYLLVKDGNAHAFFDIREIASLGEQSFNMRNKICHEGWRLRDLTIRSAITADLQETARIHFRTQIRALLRCNDTCPQRLRLEFPLYSTTATDNGGWVDHIFSDLHGSIKVLFLGYLIVNAPPDEGDTSDRDRARKTRRARRVCDNLLRIFRSNQVFQRMQAVVLDKELGEADVFLSAELRLWLQRYRVRIYSDDF